MSENGGDAASYDGLPENTIMTTTGMIPSSLESQFLEGMPSSMPDYLISPKPPPGSSMTFTGHFSNIVRGSMQQGAREMGAIQSGLDMRRSQKIGGVSVKQGEVYRRTMTEIKSKERLETGTLPENSRQGPFSRLTRKPAPKPKELSKFEMEQKLIESKQVPERLKYFLDQKKVEYLKQKFTYYDADGSGSISTDELQVFLKDSLGVVLNSDKLIQIMKSVTDPDNDDGTLTFRDFVTVWYQYCSDQDSKDKIIQMAFDFLDQDDSRTISIDEFTEAMTTVGDPLSTEECRLFYQLLNKGKAEELSEGEFDAFMREHLEASLPIDGAAESDGGVVNYLMRYLM